MPVRAGKFEIVGFSVAAASSALSIEVQVVDDINIKSSDDFGNLLPTAENNKTVLFHRKGIATYSGQIDAMTFTEPIKTRHGISVYTDNIVPGSFCLYVR